MVALLNLSAVDLWAGPLQVGDVIKLDRTGTSGHARGGGEFAIHKLVGQNSGGQDIWQLLDLKTFCLEFSEYITLGTKFIVGGISDRTVLGGVSGQQLNNLNQNLGDPIDPRTEFLYSSYATHQWGSLGFLYNNNAWANSLQEAVWSLEGEITSFSAPYTNNILNYAQQNAPGSRVGTAFALNLFHPSAPAGLLANFDPNNRATWNGLENYHQQDQLFYLPPPPRNTSNVPEPATAAIWAALALLGTFARRRAGWLVAR